MTKQTLILMVAMPLILMPGGVRAIFVARDLEKVPVARLVDNLEQAIRENPKNAGLMLNLARTHAMAFALKVDAVEVSEESPDVPWFGFAPKDVPFSQVTPADDEQMMTKAKKHLASALKWYGEALEIDPNNRIARIGQAWVTEQSGQKKEAIQLYRKIVGDAWEGGERNLQGLGVTGETITTEAGGYLIALLDAEQDREEIAILKTRIDHLKSLPRPVTPIAVPLQENLTAAAIEDPAARVLFDADGSGLVREWSWIRPNAAWLVYDPKSRGEVASGLQLFGNVTFRLFWSNGYEALAALDDNRDGELRGEELQGLAVWHDANGNGEAEPGEVKSLGEHDIIAVSCRWEADLRHDDKIAWSPSGVTCRDGQTRPTFDLILKTR